jgi:hypothetical protein
MGSHRRFVVSDTSPDLAGGLLPEHPLESYGVHRAYGIATNLREEQKDPSAAGFLDWLVGGFEDEDVAASPTAGGIDTKTGKPAAPGAAQTVANQLNEDRDKNSILGTAKAFYEDMLGLGDGPGRKEPDWKKIAIVVGAVGGGALLWVKVIQPKLAARKAAAQ